MGKNLLDSLGEEVTGIVAPVSVCMALTVFLVRILNPDGVSQSNAVYIASVAYDEQETDSAGTKMTGALLNAVIFACVVGAMTFVLFLLFKYKCYKFIYAYMGFAVFNIFFFMTGTLSLQLLQKAGIHLDAFSFMFLLLNFAVVGTLSLFFIPAPLLLKQIYLIDVGLIVAFIFTLIPEWTSWVLLVVMAIYDLVAVLCPGGPLRVLVELAQERQDDIPALVYEARPVGRGYQRAYWQQSQLPVSESTEYVAIQPMEASRSSPDSAAVPSLIPDRLVGPSVGGMTVGANRVGAPATSCSPGAISERPSVGSEVELVTGTPRSTGQSSLAREGGVPERSQGSFGSATSDAPLLPESGGGSVIAQDVASAQPVRASSPSPLGRHTSPDRQVGDPGSPGAHNGSDGEVDMGLPDSIKLGLGDFIFYSMMVGRAAMYDIMTVFSAYLAIVAGLGMTLLLLAIAHKALPALPISIALGVVFYFLCRLVLEPFLVPLASHVLFI